MNNSNIKVVKLTRTSSQPLDFTEQLFMLPDGHSVPQKFVDALKAHIEARAHDLDKNRPLTLKQICSKPFWKGMSTVDARDAGKCASLLARTGQIPLVDTRGNNSSNARLYVLNIVE